ncbi:MAG: RsmB/NOP family class I SAM-dependent RNA methyltransferase [bacterium]
MNRPLPPHVAARQAAVLREVIRMAGHAVVRGEPADETLGRFFRSHKEYGARDRRLFSQVIFSWFRWRGWLDGIEPGQAAALAYYKDTDEPHPAVDALLGDRSRELPAQPPERLVPDWLRSELFETDVHFERFVEWIQKRPPTWLRVQDGKLNLVAALVGTAGPAVALRAMAGKPSVHGALGQRALPFVGSLNLDLIRKDVGPCFEVQDLASQCVGLVCAPKPGETWWDVCAGAGGKSLHLAELMERTGRIVATDIRASALRELERRAAAAGISTIRTSTSNEQPATNNAFDGVLVDAPCSGIGTWSRNPDMRWRTSASVVAGKAKVQLELLARAADAVKPGGALVYAVCTVTRAETVAVIAEFLKSRPDFTLQPVPHPLTGAETNGEVWIWPWDGPCDGMFVARMARA